MTFGDVIDLLLEYYEEAKSKGYIHKKLAWALYQTWKEADATESDGEEE